MEAIMELFSTTIGLLSVFTIVFVIVMGVFFMRFFSNRMAEDERNAARQQRERSNAKA
ncbi:MAG: DUF3149 domain-containing protein [Betaproteobacteria bacterium]|nr:DUF3149 domain-containing protein [Betaproteobacteria bacterium]MCL2162004.1 DUF3149 domain-containing protein [Betaproteobacteria bacterium]